MKYLPVKASRATAFLTKRGCVYLVHDNAFLTTVNDAQITLAIYRGSIAGLLIR